MAIKHLLAPDHSEYIRQVYTYADFTISLI